MHRLATSASTDCSTRGSVSPKEPVKEQMQRSGDEVRTGLQAQEAMEDTKQTAQEAAEQGHADVRTSAERVQDQAQNAVETVRSQS